jgi:hypothetical protein
MEASGSQQRQSNHPENIYILDCHNWNGAEHSIMSKTASHNKMSQMSAVQLLRNPNPQKNVPPPGKIEDFFVFLSLLKIFLQFMHEVGKGEAILTEATSKHKLIMCEINV